MSGDDLSKIVDRIDAESFWEWYREWEFAQNIREGKPYFNGPSPVPAPERHSPSNLMQCHRKIVYQQENAPEESALPEGIFWTGRRFEEDIIVPYLQDAVVDEETYVRNSMWIDETIDVDGTEVRFKGATDPAIVTGESEPLVITEVKTKSSLDGLSSPNRHHRAQVHAYMHGLSESHDRSVREAVIIYGGRKSLDIKAFHKPFDQKFWSRVCNWAATHTEFRQEGRLPAAEPEYGWECGFCSFKHRCGETEQPYQDVGMTGFLPGVAEYPKERVVDYLESHEDPLLTPALAREYPELAESNRVQDWVCPQCNATFSWKDIGDGPDGNQPLCSRCADRGELVTLEVPSPS